MIVITHVRTGPGEPDIREEIVELCWNDNRNPSLAGSWTLEEAVEYVTANPGSVWVPGQGLGAVGEGLIEVRPVTRPRRSIVAGGHTDHLLSLPRY
jgi:hypothetical protein